MGKFVVASCVVLAACGKVNPESPDAPTTATMTVTVVGGGTVVSAPAGISCESDCTEDFMRGTDVTLTATPATNLSFLGWSGACSGTGTCDVTVTADADITAMFGCPAGSQTFDFTGAIQTFTRPLCVTSITVDVQGGAGGISAGITTAGQLPGPGGMGGRVEAQLSIASTDVISVFVGGVGGTATTVAGAAGFNGGAIGACFSTGTQCGGGGGGASDLRLNGTALTSRVIVAGGGGGGSTACGDGFAGGAGGGLTGADAASMVLCGAPTSNALGGTQNAGGVGGLYPSYTQGASGTSGSGGAGSTGTGAGGGGAGYFGGGGGSWMGGAGGSSFTAPAATNVTHTQNVRAGNGTVTISW